MSIGYNNLPEIIEQLTYKNAKQVAIQNGFSLKCLREIYTILIGNQRAKHDQSM